jgi:hypothetical protein
MIYQDEQQEKADRMAFLSAVGGFIQQAVPMVQQAPELAPMALEMLKFGVTAFKAGKQLEGIIDETADKLRIAAQQSEGQPKAMPVELQKAQMDSQAKMQQMQMQSQLEQQKMMAQMELEKAKQEYQAQENQLKFQLENERNQVEIESQMQLEQMKMDSENNKELLLAYLNNAAKIETTRISSGLDTGEVAYADNIQMANILQDALGYSNMKNHPLQPAIENMQMSNQQLAQMLAMLIEKMQQPRTVVRGADGKIIGVQ